MTDIPIYCESCGSKLVWSETGVDLLCENINCPAQLLYKIEYFLRTLNVEELSATTLEKLELSSIENCYTLTEEFIISKPGFQKRKAEIIISQIKNSLKNVNPANLISAFGISGLGIKNATKLIKNKKAEDALKYFFTVSKDEMLFIDGFGQKLTDKIVNSRDSFKNLYQFLLKNGLTFKTEELQQINILNGKNVAMTGSDPSGKKRSQIEKIIEENGGTNSNVNKKTNLLLVENLNGKSSKLENAKKFNIKIMTYEEFYKLIKNKEILFSD